jgi:diguanylate cyclase (GGDEF)-like protein/PAS domain S-box-containing protein
MLRAAKKLPSIAFVVVTAALVLIAGGSYWSVSRLREDAAWVAHTRKVIGVVESVLSSSTDVETGARGFTLTGRDEYLQPYNDGIRNIDFELDALRALTLDNPSQGRRLRALESLIRERIAVAKQSVEARRTGGFNTALELYASNRGKKLHDEIRGVVREMIEAERALLIERQAAADRVAGIAQLVVVAGSTVAFGVVLGAMILIRREFSETQRAHAELREANELLESRVAERTAELARANTVLSGALQDFRSMVRQAPISIAMFDRDMRYIATSESWIREFDRGQGKLEGRSHYDVHPDRPEAWIAVHRRGLAGELINKDEDLWVQADGTKIWLRWAVSPWRNEEGAIGGIIMMSKDITRRRQAEERLRFADAVYRSTQEGIVVTDLDGVIVAANPALSEITEYSESELVGHSVRILQSGRHDRDFYQNMWKSIQTTGRWQGEVWDRRKGGEVFQQWLSIRTLEDEAGKPTNYVGMFTDISRMRHATSHLEHLAHYDALTGLPNLSLSDARLTHTIETARRSGTLCALILVDLDGFKEVNDTMGHQAGDQLLQLVGKRMGERLRETDTLARWGGDEFALTLADLSEPSDAARIAEAIVEQLAAPFQLTNGNEIRIGGSAGISLFPADGSDVEALVMSADAALYSAKAAGRGTWRLASETSQSRCVTLPDA